MKKLAKILVTLLVIISIVPVKVDAASLNKTNIKLSVGETYTLKASSGKVTKWSSSMSGVASVKNGKVTALNVGSTVITAKTSKGNVKCTVNVKQTSKTKYKKSQYSVGKKFKAGFYVLYRSSDLLKASYSIYNGKELLINNIVSADEFEYSRIVYMAEDQTLYMENCYARKMEQSIIRTSGVGTFIVGTHIKAGTYVVESIDSEKINMCTIALDWNSDKVIEYIKIGLNSTKKIKIKDGQYITIVGCKLKNN